jgi:tripartite ATP-independent transporter DctM subunit
VSPGALGAVVLVVTLMVLMSGMPVAFALGAVSLGVIVAIDGIGGLSRVAEIFYGGLDDFSLVSIPMFVMMGAAIGSSPAGKDLYEALDRWLHRVPGGLVISNLGACALFAALTGSSPACCAAIGKMGIPEMRKRGYPDSIATGSICAGGTLGILIPPSITLILYGIATETSIGRLFLAGVLPGVMLTGLFILWTLFAVWRSDYRANMPRVRYTLAQKLSALPRVLPFLAIVAGVVFVLYGGVATPSEAAGVGAALCLALAVAIYRLWRIEALWGILRDTTRESVMILMIIAAAVLFGHVLTSMYVTQTIAQSIADSGVDRWVLMGFINLLLLVGGCFLPPAAIILLTSPILLPIITAVGFDPVWFGVIMTINMEIGLISPPVGLNLYIVNGIAPDVPLARRDLVRLPRDRDLASGPADGTGPPLSGKCRQRTRFSASSIRDMSA